jgi:hypothetical protein
MKLEYIGEYTGKDRCYSIAYPETKNVVYRVYKDENSKEYGLPLNSSHSIESLLAQLQSK